MSKAVLVQCTDSKRDVKSKAQNLYDESTYFCKMRAYAIATGEPWFILSAKHGLVDPETVLDPYDEYGLVENQCESIAEELVDIGIDTVEVIAGSAYTNTLTPELESHGIDVIELCRGMGIGERMSELGRLTKKVKHGSLHSQ